MVSWRMLFFPVLFLNLFNVNAFIKDCSSGTSIFSVTELSLKPDPPVAGELLDMTVRFVNPGPDLAEGTVTTSLTLNFIPFSPTTEPLCDNTKCPILTGYNDRSTSNTWPSNVHGKVTSRIEWLTNMSDLLLCIQISTTVASTEVNKTSLRGVRTTAEYDLNATYAAFRRNRSSSPVVNNTYKKLNIRQNNTYPPMKMYSYEEYYNKSAKMCLPSDKPLELVVWKNKRTEKQAL